MMKMKSFYLVKSCGLLEFELHCYLVFHLVIEPQLMTFLRECPFLECYYERKIMEERGEKRVVFVFKGVVRSNVFDLGEGERSRNRKLNFGMAFIFFR